MKWTWHMVFAIAAAQGGYAQGWPGILGGLFVAGVAWVVVKGITTLRKP